MATFDTDRLVDQVTLKGALPTGRFTDQEILDLTSDALISHIEPMLVASREEYYVQVYDQSVVASQAAYPIPYRSLGMSLREVKLIDGNRILDLPRMEPEDITETSEGAVQGFYLQANNVVLYPTPQASGQTLRMTYFVRPSTLVPVTSCGRITNISGNVLTASLPATWTTADTFDLVQGKSGFTLKGQDLSAVAVSTSSIELSATPPTTLSVGDYVCLAGESCFPHIPAEAHQLLIHLTVVAALEAMGDAQGAALAQATADRLKQNFGLLISNRVQGAPRRFTSVLL